MFLYSLSLQSPTAISQAIVGHVSGTKEEQILTVSGSILTLHRPELTLGRVQPFLSHDLFSIIRSIAFFRLAGSSKDYIIVSSDSGCIAILEYLPTQNRFSRLLLETFGKSGNKLIYVLNRNSQAELTISSPVEAHKHGVLVLSQVALDVGYSNPVFAALETDYSESDLGSSTQEIPGVELIYYELDLGLNHVVRKWSETVDSTASLLFQVPGGTDGPGGVLVCGEASITYRHTNQEPLRVPIPRRRGPTEDPQLKRTIVGGVMQKLKNSPEAFFFLLQTEDGDIFKLTFDLQDGDSGLRGEVRRIKIRYFDTLPVASSLCILKSGFLFVAAESGNHHFYQFEKLGDDDTEPSVTRDDFPTDPRAVYQLVYFYPRRLENLTLVESIDSLSPLMDCKVADLTCHSIPQIFSVSGSVARSHFRVLKHGLGINEVATSELPGTVSGVWTTKLRRHDKYDAYIILTSSDNTLVMSVGDEVQQVRDSGLFTSVTTLAIQQIGDDSIVQIHARGIRHLRGGEINDWSVPQRRVIVAVATNERQIAVALSSGEIVYFEIGSDGSLADLGPVPEGRIRSPILAVGCEDCTVRILSLDPDSTLESKSIQALSAAPSALNIMAMQDPLSSSSGLYLHIGLSSGVFLRTGLHEITGELSDTQTRFLGLKALPGFMMTPLDCDELEWGWSFSSEQRAEGIIAIHANFLHVVDPIGEQVLQKIELEGNEAAMCVAVVLFTEQDGENFLLVGTGKDMILNPRQFSEGCTHVYRFQQNGRGLEFIHKTKVEEPPMALVAFQGRLAAGIGKFLWIYDLGLKQLLQKAHVEAVPQLIVSLNAQGNRIVVGDLQHGVTMVTFDHKHQRLIPFVDDTVARWITCTEIVDHESVVGGDKFGNLWIVRCPEKASKEVGEGGNCFINAQNHLRGAPTRFETAAHFFTQDIPTSITKTNLVVGGQDVLVWSGLQGSIGGLIPFATREDADFFHKLEVQMRTEDPSPVGRDHLMYRGYYVPG
ncbi:hypothetical protein FANTH_766 [Fusarium anthophilum]|uniref:DNA damage-binding protein 1 n=1 Tax=Fusarium anthophilum TaxID=48485 RepID=A0A8H5EBV7_9HYPO|nr:hypothetical protein FANTH_766 [Fusarium anthophilum]